MQMSPFAPYIRLLNSAYGPEMAYFWGLNGHLPQQHPLEKVGVSPPPAFSNGFWGIRGPFRLQKHTISGSEALFLCFSHLTFGGSNSHRYGWSTGVERNGAPYHRC